MTDTQKRYSQIEKEALDLVWACEKFLDYIVGKAIFLESNHKPLWQDQPRLPATSCPSLQSLSHALWLPHLSCSWKAPVHSWHTFHVLLLPPHMPSLARRVHRQSCSYRLSPPIFQQVLTAFGSIEPHRSKTAHVSSLLHSTSMGGPTRINWQEIFYGHLLWWPEADSTQSTPETVERCVIATCSQTGTHVGPPPPPPPPPPPDSHTGKGEMWHIGRHWADTYLAALELVLLDLGLD